MISLDEVVEKIDDFPTLPSIYSTMLELVSNPRTTVHDLAAAISSDPACAAKLLRAVNSSVYGLPGRVQSISEAIFHLGYTEVKNLVMAISVINMFNKNRAFHAFNIIDLWKHSLAVGVIARLLGKTMRVANVDSYYTNGLLHDIGKMFFLENAYMDYSNISRIVNEQNSSLIETERQILGVNHTEIGELIARKWLLPESICRAIRYHEIGLVDDEFDMEVACVHLADIISRMLELGNPGDAVVPQPNEEIWKHMNLLPNTFINLLPEIMTDYEQSVSIMLSNE